MSITLDFENRAWKEPPFEDRYSAHDVKQLLAHARALEAMLKKHEWSGGDAGGECIECGFGSNHAHDCQLSKLLEGVEDSHK